MSSGNGKVGVGAAVASVGACIIGAFLLIGGIMLITSGPVGIQNQFTSWKASAFGSNWYVVHYLPDGSINEYYLQDSAIHNEAQSDGIYFSLPDHGKNVTVHLSTFHEHVQDPTPVIIRGLRSGRKIGFSNVPPSFTESSK
jgi:hypothetical protein